MKRILVLLSVVIGMGVLFLVLAPMALAQEVPPVSGDERATAYPGSVPPGDCQDGGQPIPEANLTFSIEAETYLTITAVDEGYTVESVFVKGGDATNLYSGLPTDPPYEDLHSPLNSLGQPAQISYWFACGIVPEVDTTSPTVTATSLTATLPQGTASKTTNVTATFSEEVQNVTSSTFILERKIAVKKSPPKYVLVDATVYLNEADGIYVLDPVQDLPKGEYRVTITTEVTDLADPANALDQNSVLEGNQPMVWTFTVAK